jgi:hypothetical protein
MSFDPTASDTYKAVEEGTVSGQFHVIQTMKADSEGVDPVVAP